MEVADSGLVVVDLELSLNVGMRSACDLCLARHVEAAKAENEVCGAGDGGPTPVGIDMRSLGARAHHRVPVSIVLSRRFATMLDERTPVVYVSNLLSALKLLGPVEVARLMLPGRVGVDIECGVTACQQFGCREGNAARYARGGLGGRSCHLWPTPGPGSRVAAGGNARTVCALFNLPHVAEMWRARRVDALVFDDNHRYRTENIDPC